MVYCNKYIRLVLILPLLILVTACDSFDDEDEASTVDQGATNDVVADASCHSGKEWVMGTGVRCDYSAGECDTNKEFMCSLNVVNWDYCSDSSDCEAAQSARESKWAEAACPSGWTMDEKKDDYYYFYCTKD